MAEVNFYLRDSKAEKNTGVMMFVSFNNKRFKIGTFETVSPKFWDASKQRAKQTKAFVEYPEFNTRLNKLSEAAQTVYRSYLNDNDQKQPSAELLKNLIKEAVSSSESEETKTVYSYLSFTEQFILDSESGKRISDKGKPLQNNTIKVYRTFKKNLIEFKKTKNYNLSFENIGLEFFEDFKDWMSFTKLYSTNTLSKHIRVMKLVLNEAIEKGYAEKGFIGKRYRAKSEQAETVYLSKQELQSLNALDLSDNLRLDKVKDLFLVGCWTGLRFSDFSNIKAKNIKNGFITIKTQKTGKEVVIPIHEVVLNILDKYTDKTENSLPPSISNQKMNQYLKEIAERADFTETVSKTFTKAGKTITLNKPKFALVSSHTARRSFATNMYLDNVPSITIMAITGHQTESSFMKYIRVTPLEHAQQLQTLWNRDKLKVV